MEVGDLVETKFRGGKRQGEYVSGNLLTVVQQWRLNRFQVEAVVTDRRDAAEQTSNLELDIKNPPRIAFHDQVGTNQMWLWRLDEPTFIYCYNMVIACRITLTRCPT
ncbi:hypothetical protein C8Q78DRAFT_307559 [Trametes maxima]|nr:hypothetical protein C8Q78DRAFT_307559 [Trametes maxima]